MKKIILALLFIFPVHVFASGVSSVSNYNPTAVTITGGTINNTAIGGTTPAAVSGTTGTFSGAVMTPQINIGALPYAYYNAVLGNIIQANTGSSNDLTFLKPDGATNIFVVPTGSQNVKFYGSVLSNSPSSGIGYTTGAGGSVTQASAGATVTLNTMSGKITGFSQAWTALSGSIYTVNNSSMAANDVVICNIINSSLAIVTCSVGSGGSFNVYIDPTSTGTFAINVQFAIIKASIN